MPLSPSDIKTRLVSIRTDLARLIGEISETEPVSPAPTPSRRLSNSFGRLGMKVLTPGPGPVQYALVEFWTTQEGSWQVGQYPDFGVEMWAVNKYQSCIPGAGADHHLFGVVLDTTGAFRPLVPFVAWTPQYQGNRSMSVADAASGVWNFPIFGSSAFDYAAGETGAWAWGPDLPGAEAILGGGMPQHQDSKAHVSFFAVWQALH